MRWGLLLINLGTPAAPETPEVRDYLGQFLDDPRVIDIAEWKRWLILNLFILRSRPPESARAYQKIWTERGSPLLFHTQDLRDAVAARLGPEVPVAVGMRYGEPSIATGLAELARAGVDQVVALPLYPQYASSSTGTALEELYAQAGKSDHVIPLAVVPPFYDHPAFVRALTEVSAPALREARAERVLVSFHGLPERHVRRSGPLCLEQPDCCLRIGPENRTCYRAHCYATARALATSLELPDGGWEVAFQSEVPGKDPWIKPNTQARIRELAAEGVKRLAIVAPSFVADCLETLEELALRAAEEFRELGGEELVVVPCLNAAPVWADAVVELARACAPKE
ncbi:MAG: ferrochelatase [Planctomycetota bacterium]